MSTKNAKIIFWISTVIIALLEGVMPALTSQSEMAKEGISHLGYPEYFGNALVICKISGVIALIIPQIPKCVKEWAYAGFTFNFIFAGLSHGMVDGVDAHLFFPIIALGILATSYFSFHKMSR
jgi:hypothetical protein